MPVAAVKEAAGQLQVQLGEAILPLAGGAGVELGDGKIRLFRLNDGTHEIGYAFAEVVDFAVIDNDVIHAERPGEISGVSLVGGEPAELVDAHWLFANHVGAAARHRDVVVAGAHHGPRREQNAKQALQMSDYGLVLEQGQTRIEDTAVNILHDPRIAQLFLGGGLAAAAS